MLLPTALQPATSTQFAMSKVILGSQTTLVVLIELFVVVGIFALLIFSYTHKKGLKSLRFAFRPRREIKTGLNKPRKNGQLRGHDLEKGVVAWKSGQPMSEGSLARVLAYLHQLPREMGDFSTVREVSIRSLGGHASSIRDDEEGSDGGSDSSWIEIINSFPCPPDAAHVRSYPEGRNPNALSLVVDNIDADTDVGNSRILGQSRTDSSNSRTQMADVVPDATKSQPPTLSDVPKSHLLSRPASVRLASDSRSPLSTQHSAHAFPRDSKVSTPSVGRHRETESSHMEFAYL